MHPLSSGCDLLHLEHLATAIKQFINGERLAHKVVRTRVSQIGDFVLFDHA